MPTREARNITRYTYAKTAFQGWRVCISRNRQIFTRYFSDKAFGDEEQSFAAALELRDRILADLRALPDNAEAIFEQYSQPCPPKHRRDRDES